MIHRRGFSPQELDDLDPELFELLKLYDERIEPNGSGFQTMMFANLCHLMLVSSGNLSERGQKEASVLDWDFYGLLQNKTIKELADEKTVRRNNEAKTNMNDLGDMIKSLALKDKKNNGRE